jgi:CRISPR-associated protein Csy1
MIENSGSFSSWQNLIVDFFENKVRESKLFKAREYIEKKESEIKSEKDEKRLSSLVKQKTTKEKELSKLRNQSPQIEIIKWLDKTSGKNIEKGKRIIKATHVLRFTHSSANSDGILIIDRSNDLLLTTSTLHQITHDLAHNNGNLITISRFLSLKLSDTPIIDCIINDDFSFLKPFYQNEQQWENWKSGFSKLVEKRDVSTVHMNKQVYFSLVGGKGNGADIKMKYHLLVPLFSSSLAEAIYQKQANNNRKKIKIRSIRKADEVLKYNCELYIDYPELAVQKYGGDNPQNVSMLNVSRKFIINKKSYGGAYLLPSQPPTWQSQLKPPTTKVSLFQNIYGRQPIIDNVDYLRDFLLRFERIELSIQSPARKKWILNWVLNIIEEVFVYAASIHRLPPGWSNTETIKLKKAHQYFLDPFRSDGEFQTDRASSDWEVVICKDFATWLNGRLSGKEKKFTPQPQYTRIWKKIMKEELREFTQTVNMHHQNNTEAVR